MTIATVIFSLLFLGLGVGMLLWARSTRKKAQASQAWPIAAGAVVSSEVKVERNTNSMDGEMQETVSYRPAVSYRYAVGGVEHTGSRITFGPASYTKGSAETMAGKYPAGASLSIFYNPQKPEEGVLETKASGSTLLTIGGIVFLLVGVSLSCLTVILLLGGAPS